jgi:hypothetical protein
MVVWTVRHEPPLVRSHAERCAAVEGAGARELKTEEIAGRCDAGQCCLERLAGVSERRHWYKA